MTLSKDQIIGTIQQYAEKDKSRLKEHEEIIEMLRPLEGKPWNRRTLNEKRLGKFTLRERNDMYYIVGEHEHFAAHTGNRFSDDVIDIETFRENDVACGRAAKERIQKIENADIDRIVDLFQQIHKHWGAIIDVLKVMDKEKIDSYHFPAFYAVCKLIEPEHEQHPTVQDFSFIAKYR